MTRPQTKGWHRILLLASLPSTSAALATDCQLNNNPVCGAAEHLGTVAGDKSAPQLVRSGVGEKFYRVRFSEQDLSLFTPRPILGRIQLTVPAGVDYDLIVRCASCTCTISRSSSAGPGVNEEVVVTRPESKNDDSFDVFIEIRYSSGTSCAP